MNSQEVQAKTQNQKGVIYTFFLFMNYWDCRGQDQLLDSIRGSGGVSYSRTHKRLYTAELSSPNLKVTPEPPAWNATVVMFGFIFGGEM